MTLTILIPIPQLRVTGTNVPMKQCSPLPQFINCMCRNTNFYNGIDNEAVFDAD